MRSAASAADPRISSLKVRVASRDSAMMPSATMSPATSETVSSTSVKPAFGKGDELAVSLRRRLLQGRRSCRSRGRTGARSATTLVSGSTSPCDRRRCRSRSRARSATMPRGQSTRTSARMSPGSVGSVCGTSQERRTFTQKTRPASP